ncbi:SET domain-containing protein [Microthyrium microscopicum]|uniref:SET domain-containing protein n=1 Tax=Microthyrium microscopicum TaxID=703497 RepID=A0A6A6U8X4_9PEZI|nr:SET domain-containing protein [Microthyrium microscopicum]
MLAHAADVSVAFAERVIRAEFEKKLAHYCSQKPGGIDSIVNDLDSSSPPLSFKLMDSYVFLDPATDAVNFQDTQVGCSSCRPQMGRNMGCEYVNKCDCLEDHPIRKFPYKKPNNSDFWVLQMKYLEGRYVIIECNELCECGPSCKTRVTQKGRQVPMTIFKTPNRGWGLKCKQDLIKGQFIDLYWGEVIPVAEAQLRQESGPADKASYLFDLDKWALGNKDLEEQMLVVDGEKMGGITRFMNHSCDPNCGVYAVSYNKNDYLRYNTAFFALEDIPAGSELTFDYLEGEEQSDSQGDDAPFASQASQGNTTKTRVPCHCGARNCRGLLWRNG